MKKVIKDSMRDMLVKLLMEFMNEKDKNTTTVVAYAESFCDNFERYLRAYKEFKED